MINHMIQDNEKLKNFNVQVAEKVAQGYTIVHKNDNTGICTLQKKRKLNHPLHLALCLMTGGVWVPAYALFLTLCRKPEIIRIVVQ